MTRTVPLYFLLLAITTQSCYAFWPFTSKPAIEFEHEHVVKLTGATFEDYVINDSDKFYFIKFFAPWCKHCKSIAPTWGQLAAENTDSNVEFAQVDCTNDRKLCKMAAVKGFPEIKVFYKGSIGQSMTGGRDLDGMRQFVIDAQPTIRGLYEKSKQEEAVKAKVEAEGAATKEGSAEL